jgi:hypothetical protein
VPALRWLNEQQELTRGDFVQQLRYWIPEPKSMSPVECEGPAPVECALDSAIGQFQLDGSKACGNKSAIVFYAIGDSSREGK